MQYYRIHHSCNGKEIGKFAQVDTGIIPSTINDPNFISFLLWEKATEITLLPKGILSSKAKKTDLISAGFVGFSGRLYISPKLKNILQDSNSIGLQYLRTSLISKKNYEEEFWIVNPYHSSIELLDFNRSLFFYYKDSFSPAQKQLYFSGLDELNLKLKELPVGHFILIEKVVFKEDINVDFFSLRFVTQSGTGFYVSEKLKEEIEKAACTGIVFTEPNDRYP